MLPFLPQPGEVVSWEGRPDRRAFVWRMRWSLPGSWVMCVVFGYVAWQFWTSRPIRDVHGDLMPDWIFILPMLGSWIFGYLGFLRPYMAHLDWLNTRYILTKAAIHASFGINRVQWRVWPLSSIQHIRVLSVRTRGGVTTGCVVLDKGPLRFSNSWAYFARVRAYERRFLFPRALLYVRDPDRVAELIQRTRDEGRPGP